MKTRITGAIRRIARRGLGIFADAAHVLGEVKPVSKKPAVRFGPDHAAMLAAKILINQMKSRGVQESIQQAEFKVFSQFGDDGIIQYLVHHLKIEPQMFIEFGAKWYTESNTRFLLMNDNWKGLVVDGGKEYIEFIRNDSIYWKYDLTTVCSFVDRENINNIFLESGFGVDIGILSIDIDGNDYWVWDAINVISPILVIIEYNSVFGDEYAITVPYDPRFIRTQAHYSNLYFGASLKALYLLAKKKGYCFIGSNSAGNNAYFVRKDKMDKLRALSVEEGYVKSKFRESRNQQGELTYVSGEQRIRVIEDMSVYDIERDAVVKIRELFPPA